MSNVLSPRLVPLTAILLLGALAGACGSNQPPPSAVEQPTVTVTAPPVSAPVAPTSTAAASATAADAPDASAPSPATKTCSTSADCASGEICTGKEGCDETWTCKPSGPCTRDLRTYCGCNGKTFQGSGSCPGQKYAKRSAC